MSCRGAMARSFLDGMGRVLLCIPFSDCVGIPIAAMNRCAEPMADALHPTLFGSDIERAARPHQHSPDIAPLLAACRDHGPNEIPCLKALHLFGSFGPGAREAMLVDIAFLTTPMPGRGYQQGNDSDQREVIGGTLADAGRVNPMRFR